VCCRPAALFYYNERYSLHSYRPRSNVIRHIVAFRLSATGEERLEDAAAAIARLSSIRELIPGVLSLAVQQDLGVVPGHWDFVLVSDHATYADLEAYQIHPAHVEAAAFVGSLVSERAVVDFEA
jgi:hypothetical protein